MKKIISLGLALAALVTSCKKDTSDRDAFIGNYHMTEVQSFTNCGGGPNQTTNYDVAVSAGLTSEKIVFRNMRNGGSIDTATVSGSLATFDNAYSAGATTATISGSNITVSAISSCGTATLTGVKF